MLQTETTQTYPTLARPMATDDVFAYYKAHAVQGDCEFVLARRGRPALPAELEKAWMVLLASVLDKGKETGAHRKERDRLRNQVRIWLDVSSRFDRREDRQVA